MEKPKNFAGFRSQRLFGRTMFFHYGTVIYKGNEKKFRRSNFFLSAEFFLARVLLVIYHQCLVIYSSTISYPCMTVKNNNTLQFNILLAHPQTKHVLFKEIH